MRYQSRVSDYFFAVPLMGDLAILLQMMRDNRIPQPRDERKFIAFFKSILLIYLIYFSYPVRLFLRYSHGIYTIGWIMSGLAALNMQFFNVAPVESTGNFLSPIMCIVFFFREPYVRITEQDHLAWWPDIVFSFNSPLLYSVFVAFCLLSVFHILISYFTIRRDSRDIKRGVPIIWWIARRFFKKLRGRQNWSLWWICESLIVGGIGAYFYFIGSDQILGAYLLIMAACHFLLEAYEAIALFGKVQS